MEGTEDLIVLSQPEKAFHISFLCLKPISVKIPEAIQQAQTCISMAWRALAMLRVDFLSVGISTSFHFFFLGSDFVQKWYAKHPKSFFKSSKPVSILKRKPYTRMMDKGGKSRSLHMSTARLLLPSISTKTNRITRILPRGSQAGFQIRSLHR